MPIRIPQLILSISLCLGAGILGSFFTISSIPTWYAALNKPVFSPPNFVFGPVWTTLYIVMGVALYLVISDKRQVIRKTREKAIQIFGIQLALNALWSIVFFGMKNPALAFVNIIALWIAIFLTTKAFYKINKFAGYLLIPYLLWVSFATILNLSIVLLNP
ncbi:MAG: hypothetical protein ACD_38C00169G0009 [uncultured bacterium]|uniref:TspO and MBR like protein n=1 Tax=Candidatus Daviesbacteria bacterium GW2011_GWC2_40_12 TaxID=1618431 RepID=A0A0G0TVH1_9BACT|nr:MAG: hypothetical protein ACD_38C00169G0009 [uncultured bacterium]KKR16133.1 MAG: TspO and MBR like protein [Candidatus Daviesbacteria bacterium GW2011_GWA2_39_33]KKR25243.1 MAG: TspO and MBR like protein [Candidatus Daviesbacteria bacterium GW2011_GWB1_39_5]KKR41912.1 MAG: TspO and MBR like protein [Candidatus Daviesbacteria bacterium GW2011_GWC2_40_12]OGE21791.1 MAG: TspO protein [Candidatus Daviesbacteria bacterium RIFCSPHIGHO2_01_FULL_40_24]OGE29463.1 MAG: TspO protein [Candidatus Davie